MEEKQFDEVYEVLDELNARIEELMNEYSDTEQRELAITMLQEKTHEFVFMFQEELEKLDIIDMEELAV